MQKRSVSFRPGVAKSTPAHDEQSSSASDGLCMGVERRGVPAQVLSAAVTNVHTSGTQSSRTFPNLAVHVNSKTL